MNEELKTCPFCSNEIPQSEYFAHARLIQFAPEMLKLLQSILDAVDFQDNGLSDLEGDILWLLKDIKGKEL